MHFLLTCIHEEEALNKERQAGSLLPTLFVRFHHCHWFTVCCTGSERLSIISGLCANTVWTFLLFLIFKLVSMEFFTVFHFYGVSSCCILNK